MKIELRSSVEPKEALLLTFVYLLTCCYSEVPELGVYYELLFLFYVVLEEKQQETGSTKCPAK